MLRRRVGNNKGTGDSRKNAQALDRCTSSPETQLASARFTFATVSGRSVCRARSVTSKTSLRQDSEEIVQVEALKTQTAKRQAK